MASPIDPKSSVEAFVLETRPSFSDGSTAAAPYRDSFDDDDDLLDYRVTPSRPGLFSRLRAALNLTSARRHRSSPDHLASPTILPDGLLKARRSRHASPRELRRCRRSYVGGLVKRSLLALPFVALIAFGILHLLQVWLGHAGLFWDVDLADEFLPEWGRQGQAGEGLADYPTDATRDIIPIACHSHNDYWRRVPLFDALHWGCTGVEADVWLYDEDLYVGHNTASLTRNRTFRDLYVNPLVELLDTMNPQTSFANATGHGVFDVDPEQSLILLVDIKTSGPETFPYLFDQLSGLREKNYLTYFDGESVHSRAVTVVGTGNAPFDLMIQNSTYRDIFFDAPLDQMFDAPRDLNLRDANAAQKSGQGTVGTESISSADDFNATNSYYASVSFTHAVGYVWKGHLSARQMETIRGQIRGAKRRGLKVRYWDTPTWPVGLRNHVWHVLMKEGADMLNVDDLRGAAVENWKARVHGFW